MAIDLRNPLEYSDSRRLRNSPGDECDGMCEKCPKARFCAFARVEKISSSGYKNSGDEEFNSRMLNVLGYSSRYSSRSEKGFSNPMKDYSISEGDYSKDFASGFHGSYDAKGGDYSKMSPKSSGSNYCSSAGCGKK